MCGDTTHACREGGGGGVQTRVSQVVRVSSKSNSIRLAKLNIRPGREGGL